MLAKDNEYLQEAAESLYVANADEIVRQQCRAREDAERLERTLKRDNKLLKEKNVELTQLLDEKTKQLDEQAKQLADERQKVAELQSLLANQD